MGFWLVEFLTGCVCSKKIWALLVVSVQGKVSFKNLFDFHLEIVSPGSLVSLREVVLFGNGLLITLYFFKAYQLTWIFSRIFMMKRFSDINRDKILQELSLYHMPQCQDLYSLKDVLRLSIVIPIIKLRRSDDRVRFIMGIPIYQ